MSIDYIEIETGQLKQDTQDLRVNTKTAHNILKEMEAEINELNGMWSGKANLAFRVQFAKDVEFMQNLLSKMEKLAECMEFASTEYTKCENEVRSLVESIRI